GFAKVWMHNEMLQVEGKKMSKSLGNFFTVRDLLDQGVPGEVIRFVMLSTHYSKPMDWTAEKAAQALRTLQKWRALTDGVEASRSAPDTVLTAIAEDLNTPAAIAALHALAKDGSAADLKSGARLLGLLEDGMGDWLRRPGVQLDALAEKLKEARTLALETKDFSNFDRLKAILINAGVKVMIGKNGITLAADEEVDIQALSDLLL
ncbi:MAG: class I tRNA ligase family protein, partial [Paracoccaceae bacterium]|nr:class I tRNA ligase family protein [Paracoccaceae bacterium]